MTPYVNIHVDCNPSLFMATTASTTLHHFVTDTLPLSSISWTGFNVHICHWHTLLSCQTSSHTQDKLSDYLLLPPPHLPPIGPLEQTRWIRGRIARRSLRIAKVLVVTAESWGRFRQTEGTHGPLRWPSPKMGNFSGTRLRLSHRGFQMKGLFNRLEPFRCLLTVLLLFVLNNCVLKAQRDNWALAIPLDTQP